MILHKGFIYILPNLELRAKKYWMVPHNIKGKMENLQPPGTIDYS